MPYFTCKLGFAFAEPLFGPAFLGAAFLGAAFLAVVFLGAAFLGAAFLGAFHLGPPFALGLTGVSVAIPVYGVVPDFLSLLL